MQWHTVSVITMAAQPYVQFVFASGLEAKQYFFPGSGPNAPNPQELRRKLNDIVTQAYGKGDTIKSDTKMQLVAVGSGMSSSMPQVTYQVSYQGTAADLTNIINERFVGAFFGGVKLTFTWANGD